MGVFIWDYLFWKRLRRIEWKETGHVYQSNRTFRNAIDETITELCACVESVPVSESPQVNVFFVIYFSTVRMSTNSRQFVLPNTRNQLPFNFCMGNPE